MSTELSVIKGTHQVYTKKERTIEMKHEDADLYLTRFFNGSERGQAIQLTVVQQGLEGATSHIHLTPESCKQLAQVLLDAFDDTKYPSE